MEKWRDDTSHWHSMRTGRVGLDYHIRKRIWSVFNWRHGGHIGVPKQWNGGHDGVPNQSCGSWTLFLCKCFLLFQYFCIDVGHISENAPLFSVFSIFYITSFCDCTHQWHHSNYPWTLQWPLPQTAPSLRDSMNFYYQWFYLRQGRQGRQGR